MVMYEAIKSGCQVIASQNINEIPDCIYSAPHNDLQSWIEIVEQIEIPDRPEITDTLAISDIAINGFLEGKWDQVDLVYSEFITTTSQIPKVQTVLPISNEEDLSSLSDYIYEPNKSKILEDIIPKGIKIMFYKAIRESFASEHGARMTAMHKATDNAAELADQLKLTYNKARQASITNEILEIVGGAEALKK